MEGRMEIVSAIITSIASIIVAIIGGKYLEKTARLKENKNLEQNEAQTQAIESRYISTGKLIVAIGVASLLACIASWVIGYIGNSSFFTDTADRTISIYQDTFDSAFTGLVIGVLFFVIGVFTSRLGLLSKSKKSN
jgi:hypothetical protein